jgi:hypothetical protein
MVDRPAVTWITDRKRPARSLREACQLAGRDDNGERCPICPLKELCDSEARWLVQRTIGPPQYH